MIKLQDQELSLRALEPDDLSLLLAWENNPDLWTVSHQRAPYSSYLMHQYLQESGRDVWEVKQLRLMICVGKESIGLADFYDFEPDHKRGSIGILLGAKNQHGKGYASRALGIFIDYLFPTYDLHQIYAEVGANNIASQRLFQNCGFEQTEIRKQWYRHGDQFEDAVCFQIFNPKK